MFARLAAISTIAFAALAAAQNCNSGPVQCCDSVESANSTAASTLLSLLGVVLQDPTVQIGLGCDPVSAIGVATGNACKSEPVCCENNNVGGVLSVGCVPISA